MERQRFSKGLVLRALRKRAAVIASEKKFDRGNGTAQLSRRWDSATEQLILRAVEYGRMKAFEQIATEIDEGHLYEPEGDQA